MFFINHLKKDEWWEWDQENMLAYNFLGGHHSVNENSLGEVECVECENWHELYLIKHFCPLETDVRCREVWISPDGEYYDGDAHEVSAEYLLEIIYGKEDVDFAGDELEKLGWVRASTSFMWEVRYDEYWKEKVLTQKQYDALWDWCELHNKRFPKNVLTF